MTPPGGGPGRLREVAADLRLAWGRRRCRRLLRTRPLVVPGDGIHVSYGNVQPRGERVVRGGRVKLLHLEAAFPADDARFNILYLVSSAQPPFPDEIARWARARGARVVWNQDGVAYPAWAGPGWARMNAPMRAVLGIADHVIYQSRFCRTSADRFLGPPAGGWEILPNCVDTGAFAPPAAPPPPDPWTLLVAGSHQQPGRVLSALEAAARLAGGGRAVRLIVAGVLDWPGGAAEVQAAARDLGIADRVELVPAYGQAEAPALFRRAHVLLHPKYKDPSPTVPLEAMASGVPVVGSRSGGLPELVGEDAGLLVEVPDSWEVMHVPDPAHLAAAVARIMGDWPRWSRAARARAERLFDREAWVARHGAIFARVLGRP